MNIIGITGTLGAGKGTIVEYLIEKKDTYIILSEPLSQKKYKTGDWMSIVTL